MCDLPTTVADDENIVRVIISPYHIKEKDKKVRHQAFKSRGGEDEVSVIRQSYMGTNFCKAKGKEISRGNPQSKYTGLAVLTAKQIRDAGSKVLDSRIEYCGHAHISHEITLPRHEPPNSADLLRITERCQKLVELAVYHHDPQPDSEDWTGAEF